MPGTILGQPGQPGQPGVRVDPRGPRWGQSQSLPRDWGQSRLSNSSRQPLGSESARKTVQTALERGKSEFRAIFTRISYQFAAGGAGVRVGQQFIAP